MSFLIRSHFCCSSSCCSVGFARVVWTHSEPPRWGYLWPSSAPQTLQTWGWKSAGRTTEIRFKDLMKAFSWHLGIKRINKYFIWMLSVELLYLLESVVELCKLIWSWDGCKFVSPHPVKSSRNTRRTRGSYRDSSSHAFTPRPWTNGGARERPADRALNPLCSDSLLQSVCTVPLHSCENSVAVQSSQAVWDLRFSSYYPEFIFKSILSGRLSWWAILQEVLLLCSANQASDIGSVWIGDVQYSSCAVSMFTMCTSDIHPQKHSEHPAVVGCFSNEQKDSAAFWMWMRPER